MVGLNMKQTGMEHTLLFPVIKRVNVSVDEVVCVVLGDNGHRIAGVIDEVCADKEHFWMRISPDPNSNRYRFSFKLDQVIKLN